jgi:hypothetical protein
MCSRLMLSVVPGMFGSLCLGHSADSQNAEHDRKLRGTCGTDNPSEALLKMAVGPYAGPMHQNSTDATDATIAAEW